MCPRCDRPSALPHLLPRAAAPACSLASAALQAALRACAFFRVWCVVEVVAALRRGKPTVMMVGRAAKDGSFEPNSEKHRTYKDTKVVPHVTKPLVCAPRGSSPPSAPSHYCFCPPSPLMLRLHFPVASRLAHVNLPAFPPLLTPSSLPWAVWQGGMLQTLYEMVDVRLAVAKVAADRQVSSHSSFWEGT